MGRFEQNTDGTPSLEVSRFDMFYAVVFLPWASAQARVAKSQRQEKICTFLGSSAVYSPIRSKSAEARAGGKVRQKDIRAAALSKNSSESGSCRREV